MDNKKDKPITDRDNFPENLGEEGPHFPPGMMIRLVADPRMYHSGYRAALGDIASYAIAFLIVIMIAFMVGRNLGGENGSN